MNTDLLKKKILDLAIHGKLVEQRPEEGTGDELFRQIQAEKQKLIKTGKLKKEKPLPPITEEEIPFELPENWKWVRLNMLISLLSGSDLSPEKYNTQVKGIPYITGASNFERDNIIINRWTEYPNNIAHYGDLLLTCKGTVGKTIILTEREVHIARQFMAITPILIDVKFVQRFIENSVDNLKSKAKSMIPGIERDNVLKLVFPLPPLLEQQRIVAKIEEAFAEIDIIEKNKELLKTHIKQTRQKILDLAIHGKLVPQNPNDEPASVLLERIHKEREMSRGKNKDAAASAINNQPFEIPGSWEWVFLGTIVEVLDSKRKPITSRNRKPGIYPYYGASGIQDYIDSYLFDENLLLLGEDGAKWGAGDKSAFCISGKTWVNNHAHVLKPLLSINLKYLCHTLIVLDLTPFITGTTVPKLNQEKMSQILIPLPPIAEQQRIVSKIEELFAELDQIQANLD